ncbi:MAG: tandem-95 repeat protein, partial [Lysobacterales bacterium]
LGIARSGLGLVQSMEGIGAVRFDSATADGISNFSSSIGTAGSVWSFYQAIDRGDTLGATGAGLTMAQQGTALYASSAASSQAAASAAQSASAALGMAAGAIGFVTSAMAGDVIGMVAGVMMMIPGMQVFGVALAIANALGLFGGDPEPYEAPTGDGHFTRTDDDDIGIAASDTAGNQGEHVRASLAGRMGELQEHLSATPTGSELVRVALQKTLRELEADLPADADIIPERLPSLSFNGYFYIAEFSDPDTAHVREIAIAPADIVDTLVEVAHYSQAVVPEWEADTVFELYAAGDPQYWYTEEQHAFVDSGVSSAGGFTPIALDLSGDAVLSGDALVYFDVDDDNYKELSQWIAPEDGVLALDRNFDGRIDAASELFSNPAVAAAYRGLGGLAWLDVNDDGVIDSRDPVFDALRLWQDANADGIGDAGELSTLADAGITHLQYIAEESNALSPTAHIIDGPAIAMASVVLAAETSGVRIEHRDGGMLVEEESGENLFYVTDAIDLGPTEEKSRNVSGSPQTLLIDRGDVQRALRSTADAGTQATPFSKAGAGLLAFGIGFAYAPAATLVPGESNSISASDNPGNTTASTQIADALAEPNYEMHYVPAASGTGSKAESASASTGITGQGRIDESPQSSGDGSSGPPVPIPRASFDASLDLLTQSDQVPPPIPLAAGAPLEGPSTVGLTTLGDALNGGPLAGDDVLTISEDAVALITQAALLANDADFSNTGILAITEVRNPAHGSVSMDNDGLIRFTPEYNFYGEASFEYVVTNHSGRSDVGTATIHVAPVNDLPIVANEAVMAIEDIPAIFAGTPGVHPLLRNDTDVEANLLRISAVSNALHGAVSLASDNTVTFIPDANYFGAAQFDYSVSDGNGGEAAATAFVDVAPVNDAPQFTGTTYMGGFKGGLLASDVDNSASDLRFSIAQNPLNGAASVEAITGLWAYSSTPCNPYTGADPFTVTVTDPD